MKIFNFRRDWFDGRRTGEEKAAYTIDVNGLHNKPNSYAWFITAINQTTPSTHFISTLVKTVRSSESIMQQAQMGLE